MLALVWHIQLKECLSPSKWLGKVWKNFSYTRRGEGSVQTSLQSRPYWNKQNCRILSHNSRAKTSPTRSDSQKSRGKHYRKIGYEAPLKLHQLSPTNNQITSVHQSLLNFDPDKPQTTDCWKEASEIRSTRWANDMISLNEAVRQAQSFDGPRLFLSKCSLSGPHRFQ